MIFCIAKGVLKSSARSWVTIDCMLDNSRTSELSECLGFLVLLLSFSDCLTADLRLAKKVLKSLVQIYGFFHFFFVIVNERAVAVREEHDTELKSIESFANPLNFEEIFEGLRHLQALNMQVARMQPVVHLLCGPVLGLSDCNLVRMMRKSEIHAAHVQIDRLTMRSMLHHRALSMPARKTL